MYESLRGRLIEKEPSRCVVEAGGIGYVVAVPLSTYERLPVFGAEATLFLHLVVSEVAWRLFGFATKDERALFRTCLKVAGIGPATALALLSGMGARDLEAAVAAGDVKALTRVKGIGKKTAERLVVELRDALGGVGAVTRGSAAPVAGPLADAHAALLALGLDAGEASERLRRIPDAAGLDVAVLVRKALRSP